jgi:hypothetical protein
LTKNYREVIMEKEVSMLSVWHDDFQPDKEAIWKVPAKWLLSQASQCSLNGEEYMAIAIKDKKLYIHGYRPAGNAIKLIESWAEEFDPWPDYPGRD